MGNSLWVPNPGSQVRNGGKTSTQKPLQYYELSQMLMLIGSLFCGNRLTSKSLALRPVLGLPFRSAMPR